jgi:superfamily II DNA/RNA helicase
MRNEDKQLGTLMNNFAALGVQEAFADRLALRSINLPTEIQRLVIPRLLDGKNIIFSSATGTGKTFAYLIPALQRILADDDTARYSGPMLLVCAPTLELCSQIKSEIDFLLGGKDGTRNIPSVSLLIGSINLNRQIDTLKKTKPLIAVGNPGRILLLAKMGKLKFRGLRFLVLDEADRLTADECREELHELMQLIAAGSEDQGLNRFTVTACSATVTAATRKHLSQLMGSETLIETNEHEILRDRIEHWAIFSEGRRKTQTLISFLVAVRPRKVLVFTGRSYDAGKIVSALQRHHIAASGLYSGMDKKERKGAIDRFRSGKVSRNNAARDKTAVLVSSDLAARGLDIPDISHIISLDVAQNAEAYIHRAGRTGRAGKRGIMVSIGDEIEMRRLSTLEKKLGITVHPKELYGGKIQKPEEIEIRN